MGDRVGVEAGVICGLIQALVNYGKKKRRKKRHFIIALDHKKKTELSYMMTYSKPKIPVALRSTPVFHQCISCSNKQCLDFAGEHLPQPLFCLFVCLFFCHSLLKGIHLSFLPSVLKKKTTSFLVNAIHRTWNRS